MNGGINLSADSPTATGRPCESCYSKSFDFNSTDYSIDSMLIIMKFQNNPLPNGMRGDLRICNADFVKVVGLTGKSLEVLNTHHV